MVYASQEEEIYALLCFASIHHLDTLPDTEIEQICLFETIPSDLTYPAIQTHLFAHVQNTLQL